MWPKRWSAGEAEVHWLRLLPDGKPDLAHLEELLKAHQNGWSR
jgi:hypothetical protein